MYGKPENSGNIRYVGRVGELGRGTGCGIVMGAVILCIIHLVVIMVAMVS